MALLILIKSITNQYDSPNVAYYCGNAFPWYYEDGAVLNASNIMSSPLVQCLEKPLECTQENYYKSGFTIGEAAPEQEGVSIYSQYGYVDSSASFGVSTNPFYSEFLKFQVTFYLYVASCFRMICMALTRCLVLSV
jgi:hypothetical protein